MEQRDDARAQLKLANAQLKRSEDNLKTAHKKIGGLEATVLKLKEKPVPPVKSTETTELKDLVNKSVKQILQEIKTVRDCHVTLQDAVSTLANAPIEITQPTPPAPVVPIAQRPVNQTAPPQRRQQIHDGAPAFHHGLNQPRDYHDAQAAPRVPMEYWRGLADDPYNDGNYARMLLPVPAVYATPEYNNSHGRDAAPMPPAPNQFQVRRMLPPGYVFPMPPVDLESDTPEATMSEPSKKTRGKR